MNDLSARGPAGRFLIGNVAVRTGFFPPLNALKTRLLAIPERSALVFRVGGPAGGPKVFERNAVRDRLRYDRADLLGLWHAVSARLFAPAELRALQRGESVDPHRRNVLDKIEQTWIQRRWHPTAFEALLFLVHGETPTEFMARRGPRLPDDVPRGENVFPPVDAPLPAPARDGLFERYPNETFTARTFVLTYRLCASDSADEIAMRLGAVLRTIGEPVGRFPRVTRELDLGNLCVSRATAAWPFRIDAPRLIESENVASALRTVLGDDRAVVTVTEYSQTVHGSFDFWETGRAAQTASRDSASVVESENPIGPDSARPRSALDRLIEAGQSGLPFGALALGIGVAVGFAAAKRP